MKLKVEFEVPDKLINRVRFEISKNPDYEDQIIEDTLNESVDDIIDSEVLLEEFKKLVKSTKVNFSDDPRLNEPYDPVLFKGNSLRLTIDRHENDIILKGSISISGELSHKKLKRLKFAIVDAVNNVLDSTEDGKCSINSSGSKINFSERLMKCFSINTSFWNALNKEFKSYYNIQLTNENGLVTIRNKNYDNSYIKFSYVDNGDETISIDIGKVEYDPFAVMVMFGNIYKAAMNSGFRFVKITDNSNDKEFKKFSPEIVKYLKDNRMNMFSWK